ncbi:MAG: hypothetical protein OK474_01190 [Thaumarchaeota archaeon]|nr:hypothetical protein [Nitrososphaerota archaeon]
MIQTSSLSFTRRRVSPPSGTLARGYRAIPFSIVVAGILISASLFFALGNSTKTVTQTNTSTLLQTTRTVTTGGEGPSDHHYMVFQQIGACSPEFWGVPWSVTVGNVTEVQPSGTPLPLNNYGLSGTVDKNLTIIVFSLPDGTYHFSVSPSAGFFTPQSGTAVVNRTDVLVDVAYTGTSCVTITSSPTQGFAREFRVTFAQSGACSPSAYIAPWSVNLGNEIEAEPAGATLPIQNDTYTASPLYANVSTIIFSVPDGTYQFRVSPFGPFGPDSGTVTVDGADVTVPLSGPFLSCTTTTPGSSST